MVKREQEREGGLHRYLGPCTLFKVSMVQGHDLVRCMIQDHVLTSLGCSCGVSSSAVIAVSVVHMDPLISDGFVWFTVGL